MLTGPIGAAFVFLLAVLSVLVPLILIASRAEGARRLAIALIVTASFAGCVVAVFSFLRQPGPVLDLSRATPFPFSLAVDRLSAFFLLLVCAVAFRSRFLPLLISTSTTPSDAVIGRGGSFPCFSCR